MLCDLLVEGALIRCMCRPHRLTQHMRRQMRHNADTSTQMRPLQVSSCMRYVWKLRISACLLPAWPRLSAGATASSGRAL